MWLGTPFKSLCLSFIYCTMYNVYINWIRAEVHERRFFACTFSTFFYTEQISSKQHIWRDISEWSQIIFKVTWIVWICHHSVQLDLNTVKLTGPLMEKRDHSTKMFIAPMHSWSRNGARCMLPTQIDLILTDTKKTYLFLAGQSLSGGLDGNSTKCLHRAREH